VHVLLRCESLPDPRMVRPPDAEDLTDASGEFRFDRVPPGRWRARAVPLEVVDPLGQLRAAVTGGQAFEVVAGEAGVTLQLDVPLPR
jgi:hypothetical protein